MTQKHFLIKSTLILTSAGMLSRIIGFFYRIFLSQTIGAEGIGIYLLLFPIQTLLFSFTSSGIETAISRFVSANLASKNEKGARNVLFYGLCISFFLSLTASFLLFQNAETIALFLLHETRCTTLLKVLSLSVPFASIHACILGYYTGAKKVAIPALSQLIEQMVRVGSSLLFARIMTENGLSLSPILAVSSIVVSEIAAVLYIGSCFLFQNQLSFQFFTQFSFHDSFEILKFSIPLTANRVCLNLLQTAESTCIPLCLESYGFSHSTALSTYGTLTGMALPLVLFPSAITNSLSIMLLPTISEAQAVNDHSSILRLSERTIKSCLLLGIFCTIFFLLTGNLCGTLLFHNSEAGTYILILCWLCPFLYLGTTLSSILNGLGKTLPVFFSNIAALFLRIIFVWFAIPVFGIKAYLIGLLVSQLLHTILLLHHLYQALLFS